MTATVLRGDQIVNGSTVLWPLPSARDDAAEESLKALARAIRRHRLDLRSLRGIGEVATSCRYLVGSGISLMTWQRTLTPTLGAFGWSRIPRFLRRFASLNLLHQFEQVPDPDNQVVLTDQTDRFGRRRAGVVTRLTELDFLGQRRALETLSKYFVDRSLGRVERDESAPFPDVHQVGGIHHHLGTTRMDVDPKRGVVDADGRVHGVSNLYVCGSSVFPTGGHANPTLTIVALAIRLADHLKIELSSTAM
jgi:choline dehydrogenase-like flavoprotein